uniref:DNA damage-inducible transcript 4 protein-like n=1 Tax=Arvicanthis niloticus TaxID=61156 RepID=UPI0014874C55|nr:DNA damage-inducible transcript 4 protein-like [Arvicanthis niloticus]
MRNPLELLVKEAKRLPGQYRSLLLPLVASKKLKLSTWAQGLLNRKETVPGAVNSVNQMWLVRPWVLEENILLLLSQTSKIPKHLPNTYPTHSKCNSHPHQTFLSTADGDHDRKPQVLTVQRTIIYACYEREGTKSATLRVTRLWGSVAREEGLDRCTSLESSDCESLDSSNSGFGPEEDSSYLDGVSLPDFELLSDPEDEHLCANLMQLLQESLSQARLGSRRPERLLMPSQLVSQVGKELLRLAYSEPCGLRGALLDVCVEQGKSCHSVAQLALDPSLVPTFQLTLVLRLDSRLWPKIQGLLSSANSSLVPGYSQSLTLSTGFRVIKKKLYSSEQLLIEEC